MDEWIAKLGITIVTTIVSFTLWQLLTWWYYRRLNRKLRKWAKQYAEAHANRTEIALAISLVHNITEAVKQHLKAQGRWQEGKEIPLLVVHQSEGLGKEECQWFAFLEQVKKQIRKIRELGATRVYVYVSVPIAQALMIGATLTNGPEAVIYHFQNGQYDEVGKVTFESIRI